MQIWDCCYLHMINDISLFDNTAYLSNDDSPEYS